MYRLVQRLVAIGNDAQNLYDNAIHRREAKIKAVNQVRLSVRQMKTDLEEIEKATNTLDYDNFYELEKTEILAGMKDKALDAATVLKNVDWSPTYLKGVWHAALDSQPAVLAEAINNFKEEDWQRVIELRTK